MSTDATWRAQPISRKKICSISGGFLHLTMLNLGHFELKTGTPVTPVMGNSRIDFLFFCAVFFSSWGAEWDRETDGQTDRHSIQCSALGPPHRRITIRAHSFPWATEFALCRGILTVPRNFAEFEKWPVISTIVGVMNSLICLYLHFFSRQYTSDVHLKHLGSEWQTF